jgi:hypothetical protein
MERRHGPGDRRIFLCPVELGATRVRSLYNPIARFNGFIRYGYGL